MTDITKAAQGWSDRIKRVRSAILAPLQRRRETWLPLEQGWRCATSVGLEIQVVRVPELGWQVELRDAAAGSRVGRPTFSACLDDAARIARYLRARYA